MVVPLTRGRGGQICRVGEDDFRRQFLHPAAPRAKTNLLAKTIFEDEIRAEDDIRRQFSDPSGPGAKTY